MTPRSRTIIDGNLTIHYPAEHVQSWRRMYSCAYVHLQVYVCGYIYIYIYIYLFIYLYIYIEACVCLACFLHVVPVSAYTERARIHAPDLAVIQHDAGV